MGALVLTVTVEKIKSFLKLETDADNGLIEDMILEAAAEARNFLNTDFYTFGPAGELLPQTAPPEVNGWIRNRVCEKYEAEGTEPAPNFGTIAHLRVYPTTKTRPDPCDRPEGIITRGFLR